MIKQFFLWLFLSLATLIPISVLLFIMFLIYESNTSPLLS